MARGSRREPPQPPPLFTGTPTSIIDDVKRLIERCRKVHVQLIKDIAPSEATFETFLLPLAHAEHATALEDRILTFYKSVSPDATLREASSEAGKLLRGFELETAMNEGLFERVDAVLKKNQILDVESGRFLEKRHKEHVRNGLNLPAEQRDRFMAVKQRLVQLTSDYHKNLTEGNGGVWFTPKELEGVSNDVLTSLEKGQEVNEGKMRLTFQYTDLIPTLRYAKSSETRRLYYIAWQNKCNQNVPVFQEVMVLRHEAARLLGYRNHAAFRIEEKMFKTEDAVIAFLDDLQSKLADGGRADVERLKQLKKTHLECQNQVFDGTFNVWDYAFYNRLMLEKDFSVDQQKIAEYFPLETTVTGMLDIFQHLFGMVFVEITGDERAKVAGSGKGDDMVWQEDVQVFSVWDDEKEGGEFLGYIYLDLFPRKGKHGHMCNINLQPGFVKEDGTRHYPATALLCNFSKPTSTKPSLLKHDEVWQLFHELGHGIHDLVAKTLYAAYHGTQTVDDFCEAPSQMLENWCWTPSQLKKLSRHYSSLSPAHLETWKSSQPRGGGGTEKPGVQMPDEMIHSLVRSKHVNGALFQLNQLHKCYFDMRVHCPASLAEMQHLNISAEFNRLAKEITGLDAPDDDEYGHGQAFFAHLLGSYDAGYYGYLSSKVYSSDIFAAIFEADPLSAEAGRRYRHVFLAKGGSEDEMTTLIELLGREPRPDAFYKQLGLG